MAIETNENAVTSTSMETESLLRHINDNLARGLASAVPKDRTKAGQSAWFITSTFTTNTNYSPEQLRTLHLAASAVSTADLTASNDFLPRLTTVDQLQQRFNSFSTGKLILPASESLELRRQIAASSSNTPQMTIALTNEEQQYLKDQQERLELAIAKPAAGIFGLLAYAVDGENTPPWVTKNLLKIGLDLGLAVESMGMPRRLPSRLNAPKENTPPTHAATEEQFSRAADATLNHKKGELLRGLYDELPIQPASNGRYLTERLSSATPLSSESHFRLSRYLAQDFHRLMHGYMAKEQPATGGIRDTQEVARIASQMRQYRVTENDTLSEATNNIAHQLKDAGYTDYVADTQTTTNALLEQYIRTWNYLRSHAEDLPPADARIVKAQATLDVEFARLYGLPSDNASYTLDLIARPGIDFELQFIMVSGKMILEADQALGRALTSAEMKVVLKSTEQALFRMAGGTRSETYAFVNSLAEASPKFVLDINGGVLSSAKLVSADTYSQSRDFSMSGCPALGVSVNGQNIIHSTFSKYVDGIVDRYSQEQHDQASQQLESTDLSR